MNPATATRRARDAATEHHRASLSEHVRAAVRGPIVYRTEPDQPMTHDQAARILSREINAPPIALDGDGWPTWAP
jgi:hypothetical protein